jgi:hypothetical protein
MLSFWVPIQLQERNFIMIHLWVRLRMVYLYAELFLSINSIKNTMVVLKKWRKGYNEESN